MFNQDSLSNCGSIGRLLSINERAEAMRLRIYVCCLLLGTFKQLNFILYCLAIRSQYQFVPQKAMNTALFRIEEQGEFELAQTGTGDFKMNCPVDGNVQAAHWGCNQT